VLLPILEDQYGKVLESGKFRLVLEKGAFYITYHDTRLPVAPRTYRRILYHRLRTLAKSLGSQNPFLQELQSILTALKYLPSRFDRVPEKIEERNREKEVIKRRIARLLTSSPEVDRAVRDTLNSFNGTVGNPRSFDHLDALISEQAYRPAFWKVAAEEINYRRFFDINHLAAIRMEEPEVFKASHRLLLELMAGGRITGLRIDHADGLWNPASYLRQIQFAYVRECLRFHLSSDASEHEIEEALCEWFADRSRIPKHPAAEWPVYVIVEKILSQGESLPLEWANYGTTGYDFLNAVNGLFVDESQCDAFGKIYAEFIGRPVRFEALANFTKKMIMLISLASEIQALSHELDRISERNRRYRDFTLNTLSFAIREVIASLGIYRTYITGPNHVSERDRSYVEEAVADAKRRNPHTAAALFDFVRDTLLLDNLQDFPEPEREGLVHWVMKFQQITGPVMAKGIEDTLFYVFNRLVSLNEVGGDPQRFGWSVAAFHRHNAEACRRLPYSMIASSTHDTKRGEDVRARINVLSEMPVEWEQKLRKWHELNAVAQSPADGKLEPDPNDECLLYQTLLGA
jgi:(1->4)-alpha-D-glucan 1-alpha-D-glucosylmutase